MPTGGVGGANGAHPQGQVAKQAHSGKAVAVAGGAAGVATGARALSKNVLPKIAPKKGVEGGGHLASEHVANELGLQKR